MGLVKTILQKHVSDVFYSIHCAIYILRVAYPYSGQSFTLFFNQFADISPVVCGHCHWQGKPLLLFDKDPKSGRINRIIKIWNAI